MIFYHIFLVEKYQQQNWLREVVETGIVRELRVGHEKLVAQLEEFVSGVGAVGDEETELCKRMDTVAACRALLGISELEEASKGLEELERTRRIEVRKGRLFCC